MKKHVAKLLLLTSSALVLQCSLLLAVNPKSDELEGAHLHSLAESAFSLRTVMEKVLFALPPEDLGSVQSAAKGFKEAADSHAFVKNYVFKLLTRAGCTPEQLAEVDRIDSSAMKGPHLDTFVNTVIETIFSKSNKAYGTNIAKIKAPIKRLAIAANAHIIFKDLPDSFVASLIQDFADAPAETVSSFAAHSEMLLENVTSMVDRIALIKDCLGANPEVFHVITAGSQILFPKNTSRYSREIIMKDCLKMSPVALRVFTENATILRNGMHDTVREEIIGACVDKSPEVLKAIAANAHVFFLPEMDDSIRLRIILAFVKLSPEEITKRAQAIEINASTFFPDGLTKSDRCSIIDTFAQLPSDEINTRAQAIAAHADTLFPNWMSMDKRIGIIIDLGLRSSADFKNHLNKYIY